MNVVTTITLPDDQSAEADEMAGVEGVLCRSNFHPNKSVARHVDFVGADLWDGSKAKRKAACGCLKRDCRHRNLLDNARPRRGGHWVETFKLYRPDRGALCDCPACSRNFRKEVFDGSALEKLSAKVDAKIALVERLAFQEAGFDFGGLFFRQEFAAGANKGLSTFEPVKTAWETPRLDEIAYFHLTGAAYTRLVLGDRDSASDAFVRMYGWKRFLPGWCKHDNPVAAALQAAFWIRRCDKLRFVAVKPGEDVRDVRLHNAKDILAELAALHPDQKILQRKGGVSLRRITDSDIAAAYLVLQHATVASLRAIMAKPRWKDETFVADRTIIGMMLGEGRSARDIAEQVGMSASMVSRRFKDAIEAITQSLGPLGSQFGKFVPRVERLWPEKRTDKPELWTGPPRPRLETGYKLRDVAMPMAFERPGITDPGREKQWGGGSLSRRVKLPPMDTLWAIAGYLAKSKIKRLPSGCAEDYPPETPHRFDWVIKGSVDINDDVIDGDMATSNSAGLFIPHWYNTRPRASDWRKIAHKLPAELKKPALEHESFIASLQADGIPSPYAPTSPIERRFATPYLNRLQDFWPREAKDGSTTYGDVTVWPDGRTEPATEKRRRLAKKHPKPAPRDAVDRINDLFVSE